MTLIGSQRSTAFGITALYYLLNPATGSHTISIGFGGTSPTCNAGAVSWTGVAQSGQPDAVAGNTGSSLNPSVTVTTSADNCWVVGVLIDSGSPTAGLTNRYTGAVNTQYISFQDTNGVKHPAGGQSVNWTDASLTWGIQAASFAPLNYTTTTQTITGKSRITASTSQTIQGKSRVTATTTQTITGKANIIWVQTNQTISGKSRLTISTLRTILGKASLLITTLQNVTGRSRITASTQQTIKGKANLLVTTQQTITGKAKITIFYWSGVSGESTPYTKSSGVSTPFTKVSTNSTTYTKPGSVSSLWNKVSGVVTGWTKK
jgi:hypothetical protein